jgi:hypothetical protein
MEGSASVAMDACGVSQHDMREFGPEVEIPTISRLCAWPVAGKMSPNFERRGQRIESVP